MSRLNVYADEPWDRTGETMRIRTRFLGQPLGAKELGASVHELLPGSTGFHLHAHYGMEEMFFVRIPASSRRSTTRPGAEFDAASTGAYRSAAMLLWNVMNRDSVGGSFAGPRGR